MADVPMKCLYCDSDLEETKEWIGDSVSLECSCSICLVSYYMWEYEQTLSHIKWERTIDDMEWALNIYPIENFSILVGNPSNYEEYFGNEYLTEIEIDHAIVGLSPQNVVNKIKTIIMFS